MRRVLVALLIACNGEASQRDAEPDASQMDAEPDAGSSDLGPIDGGEGDGFDHCPPASSYVGDTGWGGVLHTGGALFCAYPRQFDTPEQAIAEKLRVKLVSGSFAFPLDADGAPFRIPACIEDDDTEIRAGTASAS